MGNCCRRCSEHALGPLPTRPRCIASCAIAPLGLDAASCVEYRKRCPNREKRHMRKQAGLQTSFGLAVCFALIAAMLFAFSVPAKAQEPIKIGFSMALTGPLSPNGKQALLGMKIWEEETNAKGGLLGRPVKLVYYDDQTNPSTIPGIYTKLLDVDKVDLVLGPYATNMAAPAMPVIMQKGKVFIILFGLAVNTEFKYPKFFAMIPSGPDPKPSFTAGFFDVAAAQNPKPT